jgi:hypothetical protein
MTVSTLSYVVWGALLAVLFLLWWLSYRPDGAVARPGAVLSRLVTHPLWRVLLVVGYMFIGWHLFAR